MVFGDYMGGEKPADCPGAVDKLRDPRARYWWDHDRSLARRYAHLVGAPFAERPAGDQDVLWDSYLLFDETARITDGKPTPPVFWMHQLYGVPDNVGPQLDTAVLRKELLKLLNSSG